MCQNYCGCLRLHYRIACLLHSFIVSSYSCYYPVMLVMLVCTCMYIRTWSFLTDPQVVAAIITAIATYQCCKLVLHTCY